jgi:hypothetical protein
MIKPGLHASGATLSPSCTIMSDNSSSQQKSNQPGREVALDERYYNPTDEDRTFLKQQTGIQDDEELRAHIFQVQAEAYKVCWLGMMTAKNGKKLIDG